MFDCVLRGLPDEQKMDGVRASNSLLHLWLWHLSDKMTLWTFTVYTYGEQQSATPTLPAGFNHKCKLSEGSQPESIPWNKLTLLVAMWTLKAAASSRPNSSPGHQNNADQDKNIPLSLVDNTKVINYVRRISKEEQFISYNWGTDLTIKSSSQVSGEGHYRIRHQRQWWCRLLLLSFHLCFLNILEHWTISNTAHHLRLMKLFLQEGIFWLFPLSQEQMHISICQICLVMLSGLLWNCAGRNG